MRIKLFLCMLCTSMMVWQISRLTTRANSVAVGIPLLAIAATKKKGTFATQNSCF